MKQEMEIALWEYIDGSCTAQEVSRIAALVTSNSEWREKYEELLAFHEGLGTGLELDEPSMRFTKNVMEAVAATHIAPATRKYINPVIIRSIAALFGVVLVGIFVYVLANVKWSGGGDGFFLKLTSRKFDLSSVFNSTYLGIFVMVNIVLGLALLDSVFRKRSGVS